MDSTNEHRARSAEEQAFKAFKDALSSETVAALDTIFGEQDEAAEEQMRRRERVRNAYSRVWEFRHGELDLEDTTLTAPVILRALRSGRAGDQLSRRVLIHVLAELDHYFFEVSCSKDRVFDMPELSDEERAAEHGMKHDLLIALYDELEPAFDVSLSWPLGGAGYDLDGEGSLLECEAELTGTAAVGYDHGYDFDVFYEGSAADEEYVRGFVEGRLERIGEEEPEAAAFMRDLWESDHEETLAIFKDDVEIREGRFDDRPEFPALVQTIPGIALRRCGVRPGINGIETRPGIPSHPQIVPARGTHSLECLPVCWSGKSHLRWFSMAPNESLQRAL